MNQRFDIEPKDVFISFTGADSKIKDKIVGFLESKGISCCVSTKECCGNYVEWSVEAPWHCKLFLPIITSNVKTESYMHDEYESIKKQDDFSNRIIPICTNQEVYEKHSFGMAKEGKISAIFDSDLENISDKTLKEIIFKMKKMLIHIKCRQVYSPGIPSIHFGGRDEELDDLHEILKGVNAVFVSGIGGIGKTEFAKGYVEKFKDNFGSIIYLQYNKAYGNSSPNNLESIITGIANEMPVASGFEVFHNPRTLVILDNFDPEDNDEYLDTFLSFNCKKIITTRNDELKEYENARMIKLGVLSKSKQHELFEKHYGRKVETGDADLEYILKAIAGLTVFIPIIAKQCESSKSDLNEMCEKLRKNGIPSFKNAEEFNIYKDAILLKGNSLDLAKKIFKIANLECKYKKVLRNLNLLQFAYVNGDKYKEITGQDNFNDLNYLIKKNWVIENQSSISPKENTFELHPIINDLVKEDLTPTPDNCPEVFDFFAEKMEQYDYFTFIRFVEEINYDNRENYLYLVRYIKKLTYNSKMKQSKLIKIMVDKLLQDGMVYDNFDLKVITCVIANTALIDLKFIEEIIDKLCLSVSVNSIDKDSFETIILGIGMCARTGSVKREEIFERICKKIQKSVEQYSEFVNNDNIVETIKRLDNSIENSVNTIRAQADDLKEKISRSKGFDDSLHILIDNDCTVVNFGEDYFPMQYEYGQGVCIREILRKYLYTGITVSEIEKIFKSIDNKMVGNELCKLKNKIKKEFCYVYKRKNITCLSFEKCCEFINSISEYSDDKTVKLSASLLCGDTDKYRSVFEKLILNKPIDKKSKDELHKDFQVVREAHKLIDLGVDIAQAEDIILPVLRYVEIIENSLEKDDEYNRLIKAWYRYLKSISIGTSYYEKCKEKFKEWETKLRGFELKPQKG